MDVRRLGLALGLGPGREGHGSGGVGGSVGGDGGSGSGSSVPYKVPLLQRRRPQTEDEVVHCQSVTLPHRTLTHSPYRHSL